MLKSQNFSNDLFVCNLESRLHMIWRDVFGKQCYELRSLKMSRKVPSGSRISILDSRRKIRDNQHFLFSKQNDRNTSRIHCSKEVITVRFASFLSSFLLFSDNQKIQNQVSVFISIPWRRKLIMQPGRLQHNTTSLTMARSRVYFRRLFMLSKEKEAARMGISDEI